MVDGFSFLHLVLEGLLELPDLLAYNIQELKLLFNTLDQFISILLAFQLGSMHVVHDLDGDLVNVPIDLCETAQTFSLLTVDDTK